MLLAVFSVEGCFSYKRLIFALLQMRSPESFVLFTNLTVMISVIVTIGDMFIFLHLMSLYCKMLVKVMCSGD